MENLLDDKDPNNFLFICSVLAVLCEASPVTVRLEDVEKYWSGEIKRFQYDMVADTEGKTGVITFSLKEGNNGQ